MTTVWTYDFEAGVASGTAMTVNNSNFKTLVQPGWTFSNAHLLSQGGGSLAGRCAASGGTCSATDSGRPWASANVIYYRFYAYIEMLPTSNSTCLALWAGPTPGPSTTAGNLRIMSTGALQLQNNASTQAAISQTGLVSSGIYARVEGKLDVTNNQQQLKVYLSANVHGTISDYDTGLVASSSGGVGITSFQIGLNNATTGIIHYDNLAFSNSGWLGPVVSTNQPPTCNAGQAQTNVQPWSTVTLTGTDADPDGTIASRSWSQVSGVPVTYTVVNGNTVTFTAPATIAGDTSTHKYSVTDDGGLLATSTVTVTTSPVTMRAVVNGVEVPMRFVHVHDPNATQNPPGPPQNVQATVSGTGPYSVTITWTAPSDNGGSPITGYTVTRTTSPGGSHSNLAANATSDTWVNLATVPPYSFAVVAQNINGSGQAANVTTSAGQNQYRFPGDTLPLVTGKILLGGIEGDSDGTQVWTGYEWNAPEADTGNKYAVMKEFYNGGSVESCFTPDVTSNGTIAHDMNSHYNKGHILFANVAIQLSSSSHFTTWRKAGDVTDTVVYNTYYNFIQYIEESTNLPNVPVWVCMPHEPQQPSKVSLDTTTGMTPGDYADLQLAFRKCMDDYAISKVGGTDPTQYTWKRLSFGGVHTGEAFSIQPGNADYNLKHIDNYYVSYKTGNPSPKRVHDWVAADQYQQPISGSTTLGRTGAAQYNNVSKAFVAWAESKGYPMMWGEFGVRNTDADAGIQIQDFWNNITDGTHDVFAALYFNSTQHQLISSGAMNQWLFTNYIQNDPAKGTNSGQYDVWKSLMLNQKVVGYWDLGYPKAPGL